MINYRSKNPIIRTTRKLVSVLLKFNPTLFVELVEVFYNLIIINLQKHQCGKYKKKFFEKLPKSTYNNKYCFIYSSKDRLVFTKKSLSSLFNKQKDSFDLIWLDGSKEKESIDYFKKFHAKGFKGNIYKFDRVEGGPDVVIMLGLSIGVDMGYQYIGLIENDIVFYVGWLKSLKKLFKIEIKKGMNIGAVTAINLKSRNLIKNTDHSVLFNIGASMVVFSGESAKLVLESYGLISSRKIYSYFTSLYKNAISVNNYDLFRGRSNYLQGADWRFAYTLRKHGYLSLASVPSKAVDLDNPAYKLNTEYL